jgi:hypothetical protein
MKQECQLISGYAGYLFQHLIYLSNGFSLQQYLILSNKSIFIHIDSWSAMSNNSTHNSGERKKIAYFIKEDGRKSKRGRFGVGAQLVDRFDRLLDNISTKSECTSTGNDKKESRVAEVMVELYFIDEIVKDSDFHCYASNFLPLMNKREMWSTIRDLITKLKWLQNMYQ